MISIQEFLDTYYFTVGGLESRSGYEGAFTEPFIYIYLKNEMCT